MQVGLHICSFVSEQVFDYVFMDAELTKICWAALHFTTERSGHLNACATSFCCVAKGETKQNNDIESKARLLDGQNFKSALLVQRATSFVAGQKTCFLQMLTTNMKECKLIKICIWSRILINQPFPPHHHQLKNMHLDASRGGGLCR